MPLILDGKTARDSMVEALRKRSAAFGAPPTLVIVQVGADPRSSAYIAQKKKFAEVIGARVVVASFPETVSERELCAAIEDYNHNVTVSGIIVQLPVPEQLDKMTLINTIDVRKDVDGLTDANNELFLAGDPTAMVPATARGVLALLKYYDIPLAGKKVAVVGRSRLVGAPTAELMRRAGGEVSVIHSKTEHVPAITKSCDIIIVAIGKPKFLTKEYVKKGAVVVDVGINAVTESGIDRLAEEIPGRRKLVGDVDFEHVKDIVSAISPVPGGVGPMTVLSLFENLLDARDTFGS